MTSARSKGRSARVNLRRWPVRLRDWCHQFDLLKPAGEAGLQGCRAELADCSSGEEYASGGCVPSTASVQRLVAAATEFAQSLAPAQPPGSTQPSAGAAAAAALPPRGPQHVGRIAVLSLGSLGWQLGGPDGGSSEYATQQQPSSGRAVLQALLQLKAAVRDRRCAAVVSVPAALFSASDVARMQHLADGVIALESVADGSDIVRCVLPCVAAASGGDGGGRMRHASAPHPAPHPSPLLLPLTVH